MKRGHEKKRLRLEKRKKTRQNQREQGTSDVVGKKNKGEKEPAKKKPV